MNHQQPVNQIERRSTSGGRGPGAESTPSPSTAFESTISDSTAHAAADVSIEVTVVVCAYNESKRIQECLTGLTRQTYPSSSFEIVVVDDGSTDETPTIARDFAAATTTRAKRRPRIRVERIAHVGLSAARNHGIQSARGEWIAFIDADAVPHPNWLAELTRPLAAGADFVGGRIETLNDHVPVARFLQLARHRQFFGPDLYREHFIGCNMALRRQLLLAEGGFDERFTSRGDEVSLRRRIERRYRYSGAPAAVVRHERPETWGEVLRVEWKAAGLAGQVEQVSGGNRWKAWVLLARDLMCLLVPLFIVLVWWHSLWTVALAVGVAAWLHRIAVHRVERRVCGGLIREYGVLGGLGRYVAFESLLSLLRCLGRCRGSGNKLRAT